MSDPDIEVTPSVQVTIYIPEMDFPQSSDMVHAVWVQEALGLGHWVLDAFDTRAHVEPHALDYYIRLFKTLKKNTPKGNGNG